MAYHDTMRSHVTELVDTCASYPGGIASLIDAVRWFEGNSFAMSALDEYIKAVLLRP